MKNIFKTKLKSPRKTESNEFFQCTKNGCGQFFRSFKEVTIHYLKTPHCSKCGFGDEDPTGVKHVVGWCTGCEFDRAKPTESERKNQQ